MAGINKETLRNWVAQAEVDGGRAGSSLGPWRPGYFDPLWRAAGRDRSVRPVGSKGDSYDYVAAEAVNSLYKRELIDRDGPWDGISDVTLATMEWVAWYNSERLHFACGNVPPKEFEENYHNQQVRLVA